VRNAPIQSLNRASRDTWGSILYGPSTDWQEWPSLVESVRRYKWLVAAVTLVGAIAAYAWSSSQPVRYEGVVRMYLDTGGGQLDPGRIVLKQAEFLTSPEVLDQTVALTDGRLTRKELEKRLTVEPAKDTDVITIRVLDATPQQAAGLTDKVVRAYREVVARQANNDARQEIAVVTRRQRQLADEIDELNRQLEGRSDAMLEANRDAKARELSQLAKQSEAARRDAAAATWSSDQLQERAAIPDEPAEPKPLRTTAIGTLLALIAAAGLAWWLNGRRSASERRESSLPGIPSGIEENQAGPGLSSPLRLGTGPRAGQSTAANNGSGSTSGIADFDQVATSVQELFRFLDGPPQRMYEDDLPQLAAEEIARRFQVDLVAVLLDNAGEVQTMGSVGLQASRIGTIDRGLRHLIEAAARSGPRLVDHDELAQLTRTGLGGDQADSLAVVPLVRDQVGFGVLVAGRRHTDERVTPLSERELQEIADCTVDIVPYLWAWLLLRNLKLRLRTLQ
jgi:uncharacterized protein involved in exopolysaccharide biosynthesis